MVGPELVSTVGPTEVDKPIKAFADKIEPTVIRPPWGPKYSEAYSPIMAGVQEAMTTSTPLSTIESTIVSRLKTAFSAAG